MSITVNTGVSTPNTTKRTNSTATPTSTSDMTTGSNNNVATPTPTPELETATPTPTNFWDNWSDYRKDFENNFYGNPETDEELLDKMQQPQSGYLTGTNHSGAAVAGAIWATGKCIYDGVSNLFR